MPDIHPTAVIHPNAVLADDAIVGPFAVIGPGVTLCRACRVDAHAVIVQDTTLGEACRVHAHAVIGGDAQDRKYRGEKTSLCIGKRCVIRECVTVNRGTAGGGGETFIGDDCYLMAYSHVAHDCRLGNRVTLANNATLAGHVTVGDDANLGGLCAVHQFCRIGRLAFIGGGAMVRRDVPPFCMAKGDRARLVGVNRIGLERAGIPEQAIRRMELFFQTISQKGVERSLSELHEGEEMDEVSREMLFFYQGSRLGVSATAER